MFEPESRYTDIENAKLTTEDGREIAYKKRRFLPQGEDMPVLVEVLVVEGDRLDLIAERTLGRADQSWRVADANNSMHPDELIDEPGRVLKVPVPQLQEPR